MSRILTSTLVLAAITAASAAAVAQGEIPPAAPADAPPADATPAAAAPMEPAPAMDPAPPPVAEPPPMPEPAAETASPPVTTADSAAPTAAAPVEEESSGPSAWFRIDSDGLGLQLWAGANNQVGPLDVATDIYVTDFGGTSFGEFDIGLAFGFGDLSLLPMVGVGFDWGQQKLQTLIVPQLFTIYDGPVYFESWIQGFINSPTTAGGGNSLYFRTFLLIKAVDDLHLGVQNELTLGLNDNQCGPDDTLCSAQIGGRINYNALGDWDALIGLFLGYELLDVAKDFDSDGDGTIDGSLDGIVGRMTYLQTF